MTTTINNRLNLDQIHRYHDEGYLGPFTLCSPEEMAPIREKLANEINVEKSPQNSHFHHKLVYDLCTHPNLLAPIQSIFGESLVVWRSYFWTKHPGGKAVPWHQDAYYWPIEPAINVTAWLAIDPVFISNSCVQVIPGSHKSVVPHMKSKKDHNMSGFQDIEVDMNYINTDKAVPMELKPGQFFIFNERLLHYSAPNTSDQRRMGLAVRITLPFVKVGNSKSDDQGKSDLDAFKVDPNNKLFLIGNDPVGINQYAEPPN